MYPAPSFQWIPYISYPNFYKQTYPISLMKVTRPQIDHWRPPNWIVKHLNPLTTSNKKNSSPNEKWNNVPNAVIPMDSIDFVFKYLHSVIFNFLSEGNSPANRPLTSPQLEYETSKSSHDIKTRRIHHQMRNETMYPTPSFQWIPSISSPDSRNDTY